MNESLKTLEGRRDWTENEMFEIAGELSRRLHATEEFITQLAEEAHLVVCRSGHMPIEEKAVRVLDEVERTLSRIDLTEIAERAAQVTDLKAAVGQYEARIGEDPSRRLEDRELESVPA